MIDARTSCRKQLRVGASLAIGDAANSGDPLSGAGIRRSIETATHAAVAAKAFLTSKDDSVMDDYAAWATSDFRQALENKDGVYANANPCYFTEEFRRRRVSSFPMALT